MRALFSGSCDTARRRSSSPLDVKLDVKIVDWREWCAGMVCGNGVRDAPLSQQPTTAIQIPWPPLVLRRRGYESRRAAQPRGMLEGIGQLDQLRLAERSAHECHANR